MIPFGGFLLAVGLIMALAVSDRLDTVDLTAAGWIVAAVGAVLMIAGLFTANSTRRSEHRVVEDRHVTSD
jgi:energy-converting hydrogenase Eha subunit C